MKSIKLKWVAIYLALVFIIMIISGTFMITRTNLQETKKAETKLEAFSLHIKEQIIQVYPPEEFQEELSNGITFKNATDGIQGNILNRRGLTIASNVKLLKLKYSDTAIISAFAGQKAFSRGKDIDTTGQFIELINYAEPVFDEEGQVKYVIFTRYDAEPILKSTLDLGITLMFTVIIALVCTGILGFLFASNLTGPIIVLTKKAKEMAIGMLDEEIPVNSSDEIGQLTESFNNMAKELNETIMNMESEKNKMETLLHNMTDGVLAYDRNGALIHANSFCQELLELENINIEQIPFPEMMKHLGVQAFELSTVNASNIKNTTLSIKDKFITASFTPYLNKFGNIDGIVIVLQDITQHRKLDDMRKEFVANVSHEIRTPITTIKTYSETLIDGVIDDRDMAIEFLNVIESEADRMTLLVKDLLDLSQFDNKQLKLNLTKTDLIKLINQCIKQNVVLANKKNQVILFDNKPQNFIISADSSRINQVITNIISNAIKYSNDGSTIKITAAEQQDYYVVSIKDSGIGIPKQDLPHIFERFYRVDKARSRAMGGTGLGLAIAKEIIEAHKGKITATSEFGVGTTMTLYFQKSLKP